MKLFQTPTSEKKGIWHILIGITDERAEPLCGSHAYWFGGYHNNHPEMTLENMKQCKYTGAEELCLQCVSKAYSMGVIKITEM